MGGCGGCGDDSKVGRLPDAPPPPDGAADAMADAEIDAMVDAPVPLTVKLTITRNGSPAQQVQVYFQNADNSLVKSVKTDNAGEAEAVMVAGGSVTAINPFTTAIPAVTGGTIDELRTFVGVKPGDHLFLTLNDTSEPTTVSVILPDADTDFYDINTTCGSGGGAQPERELAVAAIDGNVSLAPDCTTADFLVLALNSGDGINTPVSGFSHNDVDVTGSVDFTVDPADTYSDLVDVTCEYTNIPDNAGGITASHYRTSKNDKMFVESYDGEINQREGSSATTTFPEPALPGAHLGILLSTLSRNAPHAILTWGPNKTDYEVDLDDLLRDVNGPPSYDTSVQQVQWDEDSTGATPDLTVAAFQVDRLPESSIRSWRWVIAAPYTSGSMQVPTVPDDVNDFMPTQDDDIRIEDFINAKVTLTTPVAAGYDAVRAHILDIQAIGNSTSFVTGAAGQVVTVGPGFVVERKLRAAKTAKAAAMRASLLAARIKAAGASSRMVKGKPAAASTVRGKALPASLKAKATPASTKPLKAAKATKAASARRAPAAAASTLR
jgi:hypothetical protein